MAQGFGRLVAQRRARGRRRLARDSALLILLPIAPLVAGVVFLEHLDEQSHFFDTLGSLFLRMLLLGCCSSMAYGFWIIPVVLLRRPQTVYLFERGLVHRARFAVKAVALRDVTAFSFLGHSFGPRLGTARGYEVAARTGRQFVIPVYPKADRDEFVDMVISRLRRPTAPAAPRPSRSCPTRW